MDNIISGIFITKVPRHIPQPELITPCGSDGGQQIYVHESCSFHKFGPCRGYVVCPPI